MENPTKPSSKQALIAGRLALIGVCAVALVETALHFVFRDRAPTKQQWHEVSSRIAALYQRGDLVVVAPSWGEPMARETLGDSIMPLSAVARAGDDAFARVLEVGILGQKRTEFSQWPALRHETFGKFELSIRHNPSWQQVRFDAVEHVDQASLTVSMQRPNGEEPCQFSDTAPMRAGNLGGDPTSPRSRFSCPGGGIHWVGVTIIDDEQYRPRRCIWAPSSTLGSVVLRFRQVPFGTRLVGHAGAPWLMVRDGVGPPIAVTATTAGGVIGAIGAKDTDGWIRFEWNTDRLQNSVSDLELRIAQTPSEQRFCFALEAR